MVDVSRDQIWSALRRCRFVVVGMVTARGQARTAGVVPHVYEGQLWFGSRATQWKVRHIAANPHVSVTAPIPRGLGLVPAATITFAGVAHVLHNPADAPADIVTALSAGLKETPTGDEEALVTIRPVGDFVTYGIGTSLLGMRDTERARGRVPTGTTDRPPA